MTRISIQDLKAQLSAAVAEAEAGRTLVITRHNTPVAQLSPARVEHTHRGSKVGTGRLKPAVGRRPGHRSLTALLDDRQDR